MAVVNNFGRFLGTNAIGPPADTAHYLRILPWYALPRCRWQDGRCGARA